MPCRGYSTWELSEEPNRLGKTASAHATSEMYWTASKLSRPFFGPLWPSLALFSLLWSGLAYSGLLLPTLACFSLLWPASLRCVTSVKQRRSPSATLHPSLSAGCVQPSRRPKIGTGPPSHLHPAIPSLSNQKQVTEERRMTLNVSHVSHVSHVSMSLTLLTHLAHPSSPHDEAFSLD